MTPSTKALLRVVLSAPFAVGGGVALLVAGLALEAGGSWSGRAAFAVLFFAGIMWIGAAIRRRRRRPPTDDS